MRAAADDEVTLLEQTGFASRSTGTRLFELVVAPWLDGDAAAVEAGLRWRVDETTTYGRRLYHANALAEWAIGLCELGEFERALRAIEEARGLADANDVADQISLDQGEAYARALAGDIEARDASWSGPRNASREPTCTRPSTTPSSSVRAS